jgi:hypothetical protein
MQDSNPAGWKIFCTHDHPAFCTMGNGALSQGVKWPEHRHDHPLPSSTKVKHGTAILLHSLSAYLAYYRRAFTLISKVHAFCSGCTRIWIASCHNTQCCHLCLVTQLSMYAISQSSSLYTDQHHISYKHTASSVFAWSANKHDTVSFFL